MIVFIQYFKSIIYKKGPKINIQYNITKTNNIKNCSKKDTNMKVNEVQCY